MPEVVLQLLSQHANPTLASCMFVTARHEMLVACSGSRVHQASFAGLCGWMATV
jgi:hypothetical protein